MSTSLLLLFITGVLFVNAQEETVSGSNELYVVEVYFVVEPQVVRNYISLGYDNMTAYSTIQGDISFFIAEVNRYFGTLSEFGLRIEIRSKQLDVMVEDLFQPSLIVHGTDVSGSRGLRVFKQWLLRNGAKSRIGFDVAVVWTGYDIYSRTGSRGTAGYAVTNSCCGSNAAAMVEFDGTQSTAHTTAHEIAHTIGARHDSDHNCPPFVGYVMTPILNANNVKRWHFSNCSAGNIKNFIRRRDASRIRPNCLLNTSTDPVHFDISSQIGRDIMDVQKICARKRKNNDTYFCGFNGFYDGRSPHGDLVCQYLYCAHFKSRSCTSATPTEGMMCDEGKRCDNGRCVPAPATFPTVSNIQKDCLYGDIRSGKMFGFHGSCGDYLMAKGLQKCYKYTVREECCHTCSARKLDIHGCEYGDKFQQCSQFTPDQICPNNSVECCFTCRDFRRKRSTMDTAQVLPKLVFDDDDVDDVDDDDEMYETPLRVD